MSFFQHRFDDPRDYLHHRPPYLLVEQIDAIEPSQVRTAMTVREDAFYVTGHFPGAPILPGAMMQELSTQSAGVLIAANYNPMREFDTHDPFFNPFALGVLVKVKHARYRGFARPGQRLRATIDLVERVAQTFDFKGRIEADGKTIMRNEFQLANIKSVKLRGHQD